MSGADLMRERVATLIAECADGSLDRAKLHKLSEQIFQSLPNHVRRSVVREAWDQLNGQTVTKKKAGPERRKPCDPMPNGLRPASRASTEQRASMKEWLLGKMREHPELGLVELRAQLADFSGFWCSDLEAFVRNYVNPQRDRLGLDPMPTPSLREQRHVSARRPAGATPPPAAAPAPAAPPSEGIHGIHLVPTATPGRLRLVVDFTLSAASAAEAVSALLSTLGFGAAHV